jgi:hypothetical protein
MRSEPVSVSVREHASLNAVVLALQRAAGNRGVARLLASRAASSSDTDQRLAVSALPGNPPFSRLAQASRSPAATVRAPLCGDAPTATADTPPITAADASQSRVRALHRAIGNRRGRAEGEPGTRVLARVAMTENRVDKQLRPVRAFGLLEQDERHSYSATSSGNVKAIGLPHERDVDEQSLVSSLLNQALGAPGAFHAGHLITRHLGGSFARHNMVPMTRQYNAWGTYKEFERALDKAVAFRTIPDEGVIYEGRVYIDLKVTYPSADRDDEIFLDLVEPEAVKQMRDENSKYYDFMKSLCERVPKSVELVEAKKYLKASGGWVDVKAALAPLPQAASPRSGGPGAYVTQRNWRNRADRWLAVDQSGYPSTHLYGFKDSPPAEETVRRGYAGFAAEQIEFNQRKWGGGLSPISVEAKSAGLDVVAEYNRNRPPLFDRPKKIAFGKTILEGSDENLRRELHSGVSLTTALETKTLDEIKAEIACAADPNFLGWVEKGYAYDLLDIKTVTPYNQVRALRWWLTNLPIMTLIAQYEAGDPKPHLRTWPIPVRGARMVGVEVDDNLLDKFTKVRSTYGRSSQL